MIKLVIPAEDIQRIFRARKISAMSATELVEDVTQRICQKVRAGEEDSSSGVGGPVNVSGEFSLDIDLLLRDGE